jgi:hypothetical protein
MITFVSASSKEYLRHFLILHKSIKTFYPDSKIILYTVGHWPLPVEVDERHYMTSTSQFASKKAAMCLEVLEHGYNQVVYCGADTEFYAPLPDLPFCNIAIVPHICRPLPLDGRKPSENEMNFAGHCNADFIAMNNTVETRKALEWWNTRCQSACRIDKEHGHFNEQSWLSLMPHLFEGVVAWRTMCANVAYWNCHLYNLRKEDGVFVTDGGRLSLFHFSAFDAAHPAQMSIHQNRHVASGDILELYQRYANFLKA